MKIWSSHLLDNLSNCHEPEKKKPKLNHSGERGLALVPWRLISSGVCMGENRDLQYSPPVPRTSELITWNSVKIYELALLIFKFKSSKSKKKFLAFLIIFRQLTQSAITRFYTSGNLFGLFKRLSPKRNNPLEHKWSDEYVNQSVVFLIYGCYVFSLCEDDSNVS